MSAPKSKGAAKTCAFTYADGRQCRMPRKSTKDKFCFNHHRKQNLLKELDESAINICEPLTGCNVTASAISQSLARLYYATAVGQISPRTAASMSRVAN